MSFINPTDVIFTGVLSLRKFKRHPQTSLVCKDIRRVIIKYLYESDFKYIGKTSSVLKRSTMNGVNHGIIKEWHYESGELKSEEMYKDGELDGITQKWYISGELQSEETYSDGELNGLLRIWYRSGQLMFERIYKNGNTNGVSRTWHESGVMSSERMHSNGYLIGVARYWRESGELNYEKMQYAKKYS